MTHQNGRMEAAYILAFCPWRQLRELRALHLDGTTRFNYSLTVACRL